MKAAVQKAVRLVEVEQVPELVCRPDQIKVKLSHIDSLDDINQAFEDQRHGKVMKAWSDLDPGALDGGDLQRVLVHPQDLAVGD